MAIGLLSLIVLPLPFIRSIGIGGMLIPAVSVLAAITLLPALLYVLGPRINSLRVLPRRLVEGSDDPGERLLEPLGATSSCVARCRAAVGLALVGCSSSPASQLNPSDAQAKDFPGAGDAIAAATRSRTPASRAGVHQAVRSSSRATRDAEQLARSASGSTTPRASPARPRRRDWRTRRARAGRGVPDHRRLEPARRATTIARLKDDMLPALEAELGGDARR